MEEVEARFGRKNKARRDQMESIRWLVPIARRAGVLRIVINGSFVTKKARPDDVDCALLIGADYPLDVDAATELERGLPFLQVEIVFRGDFDNLVGRIFSTDRRLVSKGMIEVIG